METHTGSPRESGMRRGTVVRVAAASWGLSACRARGQMRVRRPSPRLHGSLSGPKRLLREPTEGHLTLPGGLGAGVSRKSPGGGGPCADSYRTRGNWPGEKASDTVGGSGLQCSPDFLLHKSGPRGPCFQPLHSPRPCPAPSPGSRPRASRVRPLAD